MEKLNLKEGIYLHVVTSLSSLDFGTCLILCSFSWLKWFKIWHSKGRFCSCLGYRTGSSVLTHTPTGWWNLDGGLHNCQLTTAACNSRGESKNLFYCWHAAVPNTMRLVWTSYSVHPRSFTYAVPSGMPIFDSELVVELWEGFHFKLKGLESFGQRVTNWDLRHSETMHFSGSMMINDDQWWLGLGGTIPKRAKHYKIPMNWFVQWSEYCFFMCYPHIYLGDHPNIWGWDVTMTHVWKAMLIWGAQLKPRWTRCFWMFLGPFDPKI